MGWAVADGDTEVRAGEAALNDRLARTGSAEEISARVVLCILSRSRCSRCVD